MIATETRIFKVTEGAASHWVFARSVADALDVVREAMGGILDPDQSVEELTREQALATPILDEDGSTCGTLWDEFETLPNRSYVGGTEV